MLHDCSEIDDNVSLRVEDAAVLDVIDRTYTFARIIGQGLNGIVYLMGRGREFIAMKVGPRDADVESEIRISCALNALQKETGIFPRTYGWLSCAEFPKFMESSHLYPDRPLWGTLFFYIFYEYVPLKWNDEGMWFSDVDCRTLYFIIIHGLAVVRRELGFFHRDIHGGNILLQILAKGDQIHLQNATNGYSFVLKNIRLVPKIIDYGLAVMKTDDNDKRGLSPSDIQALTKEFEKKLRTNGTEESYTNFREFQKSNLYRRAENSLPNDYMALEELLLDSYFDIPEIERAQKPKKPKLLERCLICSSPAQKMWNNASGLKFCDEICAAKTETISTFLPGKKNKNPN